MTGCVTFMTGVGVSNGDTHQHRRLVEVVSDTVGRILEHWTSGSWVTALSEHLIGSTQLRVDLIGRVSRM